MRLGKFQDVHYKAVQYAVNLRGTLSRNGKIRMLIKRTWRHGRKREDENATMPPLSAAEMVGD